ncbi:hypothetical protein [Bradyrhizobium sp. USDA 3364]
MAVAASRAFRSVPSPVIAGLANDYVIGAGTMHPEAPVRNDRLEQPSTEPVVQKYVSTLITIRTK